MFCKNGFKSEIMPINTIIKNIAKKWLLSIDRVTLFTVIGIISIGVWVNIASTPGVALKLGLPPFYFVKQHMLILPICFSSIIFISFIQLKYIRKFAIIGYWMCIILVILTILFGPDIKGAKRWLIIYGISLQPSEFFKPLLAVITAWLISEQYQDRKFPGIIISFVSIALIIPLLLLQPDVGMTIVILLTWISQLFVSGLSVLMIGIFIITALSSLVGLYYTLPHFADRIDRFLMKSSEDVDLYQVQKSLEAFKSGGLFGKGPGEGVIKTSVPDSHSDFVFSVIGEEFGFIVCAIIIGLFIILVIRPLLRIMKSSSIFIFSAVFGIVFQITLQVLINIATSLDLTPTKGMTLPFISYGGSSLLASSISIGIVLALTKKNIILSESI
ncbi:MAG: FtsW/RodA/SpoVE family cell cycle protein [Holosporales bacterium]|jgi:cell division protein FtsW|nr:FtsW/RodA/SpoVE family cell cycle protein [Holosporales bacterium]